jgi:hypothetical protein
MPKTRGSQASSLLGAWRVKTDPPEAANQPIICVGKPKDRDEGVALIVGVRLLQVLIIFVLWLIMR